MSEPFRIYTVPIVSARSGDDPLGVQQQSEQMGSKRKFWHCDLQTECWSLFKYSQDNTGEHWSEKVACELAALLGIPHAIVELAVHAGATGALVQDLRPDRQHMSLLHGNELLLEYDPVYPSQAGYRVSEHTVSRVAQVLGEHRVRLPELPMLPRPLPTGVDDALGLFVGYLFLDAIIGNTDRHHENWAVIASRDATGARVLQLAPTYDHASSLGRELPDAKRIGRLRGVGARGVKGYAERTRSAMYASNGDIKPLSPRAAFLEAGKQRPAARDAWLRRCRDIGADALVEPLTRIPAALASEPAVAFASALLRYNIAALFAHEDSP
ncbi:MAG: hypothetical protein RL701_3588 [Pseudomonadota bacterium]|jgi:hypothetical protein